MTVKNCNTCAHRHGSYIWGKCLLSGFFCSTERQYPHRCGVNFENWVQRKTLFVRFIEWFTGPKSE